MLFRSQAKRLGAANVTLTYRRGEANMGATAWERDLARLNGATIRTWAVPVAIEGDARCSAVRFQDGQSGETYAVPADTVLKAIGQTLVAEELAPLETEGGKLKVDQHYRTSVPGVFAGGDCIAPGQDLTVQAVEDGKRAAEACDLWLKEKR